MNRKDRRARERAATKYDKRQTFTKQEVEDMNAHAFKLGTAMALYAASKALQLGDLRLDRIRGELRKLELQYIEQETIEQLPFDVYEINRYGGRDIENKIKANAATSTRKD